MAMSRSLGATSLTRVPPIYKSPLEMSSSPAIMRSAVLLPQPDGPTRTRNSWSWISRFRSSMTAGPSPYRLDTWSNRTSAIYSRSFPHEVKDVVARATGGKSGGGYVLHNGQQLNTDLT